MGCSARRDSPVRRSCARDCQIPAYGHGALLLAGELNRLGVEAFCVATAQEGAELRQGGVSVEILVLGYTPAPMRQ